MASGRYPGWMLECSFGGLGTAVSPDAIAQKGCWPDGKAAPMAHEACARLIASCQALETDLPPCFVFLVGGAGNGKSKIASDTIKNIGGQQVGNHHVFAQRIYKFVVNNGKSLYVVNDATIPPSESSKQPALANDISHALGQGSALLACVNRGVLIGETSTDLDPSTNEDLAARLITCWLLDANEDPVQQGEIRIEPQFQTDHYAFSRLLIDGAPRAFIHVVFMDQASLLEPWPDPAPQNELAEKPLNATLLKQVPINKRRHVEEPIGEFVGLLSGLAAGFKSQIKESEIDPILANAQSLSSQTAASAWCAVLRGAEIISGSHFTYRDLWALATHSLIGPCTASSLVELSNWVQARQDIYEKEPDSSDAWKAMVSLSSLRTHMLLFDAGHLDSVHCPATLFGWPLTSYGALKSIMSADPLRDFGPNNGKEYTNLMDRLATIEDGAYPGQDLAEENPLVRAYWTKFDSLFEEATAKLLDPEQPTLNLKQRNELLDWYGRYLFRLVAISRGWPAHTTLIDEWQEAWVETHDTGRLPRIVEKAFKNIVLPLSSDGDDESHFPVLRSRVDVTTPGENILTLGIPRNEFKINARTSGDSLILTLRSNAGNNDSSAESILDFHMVREALIKNDGMGFTDSLNLIEPRVERIRASLLSSQIGEADTAQRYCMNLAENQIEFTPKLNRK